MESQAAIHAMASAARAIAEKVSEPRGGGNAGRRGLAVPPQASSCISPRRAFVCLPSSFRPIGSVGVVCLLITALSEPRGEPQYEEYCRSY